MILAECGHLKLLDIHHILKNTIKLDRPSLRKYMTLDDEFGRCK